MDRDKNEDRRKDERYTVENDEALLISMESIGVIKDVSFGGISLKSTNASPEIDSWFSNMLLKRGDFFLVENIPVKKVWKSKLNISDFGMVKDQNVGLEFNFLTDYQQHQIKKFIRIIAGQEQI